MKKNGWVLLLFIILGLIAGALAARSLANIAGISFLSKSLQMTLSPAVDLYVLQFNMTVHLDISLLSLIGIIAALWIYRKL
ncbi:DUF4321 domain-containing protein [Paenibacillus protaetiae]|uniref:DUF4321 domain-containing protein n=1 Tax=Paenibacillus protaetiae TaxID=2509456 RepID=A0A4P6EU42_9BACL|nr:DUF4321 domain-containing protein [Paenibacillus protaetiae]QAY65159.1 DUF4321 domain-containing protein [Paenibacillus protaetiae]